MKRAVKIGDEVKLNEKAHNKFKLATDKITIVHCIKERKGFNNSLTLNSSLFENNWHGNTIDEGWVELVDNCNDATI